MIEQTELVVDEWIYIPPIYDVDSGDNITAAISLEVMKKTAQTKKGIACRFSCKFRNGEKVILLYVAQDSYVIDLEDKVDKREVLNMIRNSYSKFNEKFDFRKLGTILQHRTLTPLDEAGIDIDAILPLLN
ncbi:hypothetical protein BH11BAC4_BH11BAC4_08220 [soil metagenome]